MKLARSAVYLLLGLAAVSCKLIPEEFNPTGPNGTPTATPTTGKTPRPRTTPSGETPTATPTDPGPTPTPTPRRTPRPKPTNDGCPVWPGNCNPTVRVGAVVFYVSCPEGVVPNSKYAERADKRCSVRLDCNARDASDAVTWPKGTPKWTFVGTTYPYDFPNQNPFTPMVHGGKKGSFKAFVTIDGVRSNIIKFEFK